MLMLSKIGLCCTTLIVPLAGCDLGRPRLHGHVPSEPRHVGDIVLPEVSMNGPHRPFSFRAEPGRPACHADWSHNPLAAGRPPHAAVAREGDRPCPGIARNAWDEDVAAKQVLDREGAVRVGRDVVLWFPKDSLSDDQAPAPTSPGI